MYAWQGTRARRNTLMRNRMYCVSRTIVRAQRSPRFKLALNTRISDVANRAGTWLGVQVRARSPVPTRILGIVQRDKTLPATTLIQSHPRGICPARSPVRGRGLIFCKIWSDRRGTPPAACAWAVSWRCSVATVVVGKRANDHARTAHCSFLANASLRSNARQPFAPARVLLVSPATMEPFHLSCPYSSLLVCRCSLYVQHPPAYLEDRNAVDEEARTETESFQRAILHDIMIACGTPYGSPACPTPYELMRAKHEAERISQDEQLENNLANLMFAPAQQQKTHATPARSQAQAATVRTAANLQGSLSGDITKPRKPRVRVRRPPTPKPVVP